MVNELPWRFVVEDGDEKTFAYVPHGWVVRALALGWEIASPFGLGHHGEYATLMLWATASREPEMPWAPRKEEIPGFTTAQRT